MAEKRKLLFFTLNYYWMDRESFLKSREYISLLRTHEELPQHQYSHKITYQTFVIDLNRSREELFSALDYKSARYTIKRALKSGVVVKVAKDQAEKRRFYDFYQSFLSDPRRKNQVLSLGESELEKLVVLYATSSHGEYLGGIGLLPSPDGRYLLYKYSATLRQCCENDLLVWQAIQYAKEAGYAYFDMSWMIPGQDKESKQYRLYQYKKKFGGELVDFYSFVRLRGPFRIPGLAFKLVLKYLFGDDINRFTLCLKKLGLFR
jgi:hypothetical protein